MPYLPNPDQTAELQRRNLLSGATSARLTGAQPATAPATASVFAPERIAELQASGLMNGAMAAKAARPLPPAAPAAPAPAPSLGTPAPQAAPGAGLPATQPPAPAPSPAIAAASAATAPPVASVAPPAALPAAAEPPPSKSAEFMKALGAQMQSGAPPAGPVRAARLPQRQARPVVRPRQGFQRIQSDRDLKTDILPVGDAEIGNALMAMLGENNG